MHNESLGLALLIIDVQKALFDKATPVYQGDRLIENINSLIERARESHTQVIFIQHENSSWLSRDMEGWQLHPGLRTSDDDAYFIKSKPSAFSSQEMLLLLDSLKVRRVVVTGLVTHGCVKSSCEEGIALGYEIILAADGHSSWHKSAGKMIDEWNQRLGVMGVEVRPSVKISFIDFPRV